MREKLRDINFRLTELANYLNLSRPTLYKYIEDFENQQYEQLSPTIRKIFIYIESKSNLTKKDVISYIVDLLNEDNIFTEGDIISREICNKLKTEKNEKLKFINNLIKVNLDEDRYKKLNNLWECLFSNQPLTEDILTEHFQLLYALYIALNGIDINENRLNELKNFIERVRKDDKKKF